MQALRLMRIRKVNLPQTLNLLYYIFNRLLFDAKLPTVPVVVRNLDADGCQGWFDYDDKNRKPVEIVISSETLDPVKVLVHEMTHVYQIAVLGHAPKVDSHHTPSFVKLLYSRYKKLGFDLDPQDVL
jgi:hypothetical protein